MRSHGQWMTAAITAGVLATAPVEATIGRFATSVCHGAKASGARRGRPRKFDGRPSRAVTLTLPDDVIAGLKRLDGDLSRAVARVAEPLLGHGPRPPVELTPLGDGAVIVVPPNPVIEQRTGAKLVPLPDGRALVSLETHGTAALFELRVRDALDDPSVIEGDRALFQSILDVLRRARQAGDIEVVERSIIVLARR